MWHAILFLLSTFQSAQVHEMRTAEAPPCYVAEMIIVTHDDRDAIVDRVVTTGIWQFDTTPSSRGAQCIAADSGSIAILHQLLRQRLDSTSTTPGAHTSQVLLRDTSLALIRHSVAHLVEGAESHRGAFNRLEVLVAPHEPTIRGRLVKLGVLARDSAKSAACAAANDSLPGAAPFRWAC